MTILYGITFTGSVCSDPDYQYTPDYNIGFIPTSISIINNSLNYEYNIFYVGNSSNICSGNQIELTQDSDGNYTNIQNQLIGLYSPIMMFISLMNY